MTIHGSSRGRGHVWLVLLAVLGAALVSVVALAQWDSPARAEGQQKGGAKQITLERSAADPVFQRELTEASNGGVDEPQIIGGTPVPQGKYNFMAFLDITFSDGFNPQCGGTLIDPDSVLTAAHCVAQPQKTLESVGVFVGGTDITTNTGWFKRFATTFEIHPKYTPGGSSNYDVAVLKLNTAVTGNWSKPIKLNTSDQAGIALESPGRVLTAAGWGQTSPGGSGSDRMNEVSLRVVPDATAQQEWSTQPPAFHYSPPLMVATSSQEGKDVGAGDSGGPLFNPGATPTQVGIVSYGPSRPTSVSRPGAYTDINNAEIRTFIVNAAAQ